MANYTFRPMTRTDLPMFKHWLDQPHIEGWWGDSGTEARLVEDDMETGKVDMRIVETGGAPFAYIQDYNAHEFGAPHYAGHPADARAIDTFLGDPAYLGKGHGRGYIAARLPRSAAILPGGPHRPRPEKHPRHRSLCPCRFSPAGHRALRRWRSRPSDDPPLTSLVPKYLGVWAAP